MRDSVRKCLVKGQMNGKEIILVETVVFEFFVFFTSSWYVNSQIGL